MEVECERPLAGPARYRLAAATKVRFGRREKRFAGVDSDLVSIEIPDRWMSSRHAELRLGERGWQLADLDSKNGTRRNEERVQSAAVGDGDRFQLGHTLFPAALRDPADQVRFEKLRPEEEQQRTELIAQLGRYRGNLAAVARAMGQHRTQVIRWMERYGLDENQFWP